MIDKLKQKNDNDIFAYTYNEGVVAFNSDNFELALDRFKTAKNLPNAKPKVTFYIALCYQNLNDIESAIATYQEYITEKPYAYEALLNLFYIYYDLSNYDKAAEIFLRSLNIHKEEAMESYITSSLFDSSAKKVLEFFKSILYSENGKYTYIEMLKFLEKKRVITDQTVSMGMIIDLYIQYREHTNEVEETDISIAKCYIKMNNWDRAIYHAQKAVIANPDSYVANEQLGFIYYCCAQYDKSINYYKKAIELAPDLDYKLYSNLAYAYEKIQKLPEAIRQFEILLSKYPDIPAFYELKFHNEYLKTLSYKK